MSTNRRCRKSRKEKLSILIFLGVLFIAVILPFILDIYGNLKARFFGDIISGTLITIVMFIIGTFSLILHKNRDDKLLSLVRVRVLGIALLLFSIFFATTLLSYYKDLPKAINSDYSYYDGKLIKFHVSHGRSTSTYFTIGNKDFRINGAPSSKDFLIIGKEYDVEFLPNSKYVIGLYRYENIKNPFEQNIPKFK